LSARAQETPARQTAGLTKEPAASEPQKKPVPDQKTGGTAAAMAKKATPSSVSKPGEVKWVARHRLTRSELHNESEQWKAQGYRLTDLNLYAVGSSACYAAIWQKGNLGRPWHVWYRLTEANFTQEHEKLVGEGYQITRISVASVGNNPVFSGFWEKKDRPATVVRYGLTADACGRESDNRAAQGYRPIWISGYAQGLESRYAAIWEKSGGPTSTVRYELTAGAFGRDREKWRSQGYRPICLSGFTVAGRDYYAAIWQKRDGPSWVAWYGVSMADYQGMFDQLVRQGLVPVLVSGYTGDGQGRFAAVWESR
jgi:hypothetical protein